MTGQYVKLRYERAEVFARIMAQCIDFFVSFSLLYCFHEFLDSIKTEYYSPYFDLFVFICFSSINLFLEYNLRGKTVGKFIMRLRVVSNDCIPPSFHQSLLRWVLFPVDCLLVGFIFMTKSTGRLGDLAAGCQVVSEKQLRKVDIDKDFRCYDDGYTPVFQDAKSFSPNVVRAIYKVLYDRLQSVYLEEVAALVRQKIDSSDAARANGMSDVAFLKQVMQDAMFFDSQSDNS